MRAAENIAKYVVTPTETIVKWGKEPASEQAESTSRTVVRVLASPDPMQLEARISVNYGPAICITERKVEKKKKKADAKKSTISIPSQGLVGMIVQPGGESDRPPSQPRPQKSPVFAGVAVRGGRSLSLPGCIDSYGRLDFGKYLTLVFFPISKNLKKAECASTIRWGSLGHAL